MSDSGKPDLYVQVPKRVYLELIRNGAIEPLDDKYGVVKNPSEAAKAFGKEDFNTELITGTVLAKSLMQTDARDYNQVYIEKRSAADRRIDLFEISSDGHTSALTAFAGIRERKPVETTPNGFPDAYSLERVRKYGVGSVRRIELALEKTDSDSERRDLRLEQEKSRFLESAALLFSNSIKGQRLSRTELEQRFNAFDKMVQNAVNSSDMLTDLDVTRGFFKDQLRQIERRHVLMQ